MTEYSHETVARDLSQIHARLFRSELRAMVMTAAIYFALVTVMSIVSFGTYAFDKSRAVHGGRRVPEKTLHLMALLGGWPGAMLGQRQFRHKTKKLSFRIEFWLTVVLHMVMAGTVAYAAVTWPPLMAGNRLHPQSANGDDPLVLHPGSELPSGGIVLPAPQKE